MRIVNFAHGAFFMLGAYVGYSAVQLTGSFWVALMRRRWWSAASARRSNCGILRRLYRRDGSAFLMVTFGLTLVMGEAIRLIWGVAALKVPCRKSLSGIVFILRRAVSDLPPVPGRRRHRRGLAIWQFLERTRLGLLIRATSQNAEMVHALGTDVRLVRSAVFGIGCGLAGIGGVLAAPLVTASLGMAPNAVIDTFVIVIIGGMGSFLGSLIGARAGGLRAGVRHLLLPRFRAGADVSDHAAGAGGAPGRPARQGGVSDVTSWRVLLVAALVLALLPLGLPPYAHDAG